MSQPVPNLPLRHEFPRLDKTAFVLIQEEPGKDVFLHWKKDGEEECSVKVLYDFKHNPITVEFSPHEGFEPLRKPLPDEKDMDADVDYTSPFSSPALHAVHLLIKKNKGNFKLTREKGGDFLSGSVPQADANGEACESCQ